MRGYAVPADRRLLAEALVSAGEYGEALALYRDIVTGIYAAIPGMLPGMARAAYGAKRHEIARRKAAG